MLFHKKTITTSLLLFITFIICLTMNNHMIISVAAKKAINKEEQPIVEQTFTLTGVTLGKANEHKDKIKADIASALSVSQTYVNVIKVLKNSQTESKLTYTIKAASTNGQNALCTEMNGNTYLQKMQAKISEATGIDSSEMTVVIGNCQQKKIMVQDGTSTKEEIANLTSTNTTKNTTVDSHKDVEIIDHKGVNTVVTPKHVIQQNNETNHDNTIVLSECPKGIDGKICSDNGKCAHLSIGTEDSSKTVIEKICYCKPGYRGVDCSKHICNSPCGEHGVCKVDAAGLNPRCHCDKGWGGDGCAEKTCPNSDLKSKIECSNHGLCGEYKGEKICYCEPNYYGDGCQYEYVQLPKPSFGHNITHDPLVPKTNVVDLDVKDNSTSNNTKLTGCRAVQFTDAGRRSESLVCNDHGICVISPSVSNPDEQVHSCKCDDGYDGPLCTIKVCTQACAENGGTCDPVSGTCKNCPANRYGTDACESSYCGKSANDHLGNQCYNNGVCSNVTGLCTCFVDSQVDGNRCKDKPNNLCKPESCSFGKCVNATHCKCDPGFTGQHCDKLICPEDCNWDEFKPQGECVYNDNGDMSSGKCQCYPGWESDACDKQMATYEAGSACDQDCSSQCLDDFPSRCKISFDYYTTVWDQNSKSTVAKQVPVTTKKMRPTLEMLHINANNWTRSWRDSQGPESKNIKNARMCFLGCVTECLSSCQKELQLKSDKERSETKKNTLVKDQLEMSGHISQDNLRDAALEHAAKQEGSEAVLTNKMVTGHNNDMSNRGETEGHEDKKDINSAGDLDGLNAADASNGEISIRKVTNKALAFKAVGEKLEDNKKKNSGILGWIGSFFSGNKK